VRISCADVNNFSKIRTKQYSTDSDSDQKSSAERTFKNELPDGTETVKRLRQTSRRKLNEEEIAQIIIDYTKNNMGVCEIGRKNGCHYTTISKLLKTKQANRPSA